MNIEKLKRLWESNSTIEDIVTQMGVSERTIKDKLRSLGYQVPYKICKANDPIVIDKVEKLVKSGKTNSEIADELKISKTTARRYTELLGYDTNSKKAKRLKNVVLSQEQLEIIYGGMLGDMCITKTQKSARLSISQGGNHEKYFDAVCSKFDKLLGKINKTQRYDKRTNKYYNKFAVRTLANEAYLNLYDVFYKNGKKTITKE